MKISLTKDMDKVRASGLADLDSAYAKYRGMPSALALMEIRFAKALEAILVLNGEEPGPLLSAEATAKGVAPRKLALAVLAKMSEDAAKLAPTEAERQIKQARIRAAKTPGGIKPEDTQL